MVSTCARPCEYAFGHMTFDICVWLCMLMSDAISSTFKFPLYRHIKQYFTVLLERNHWFKSNLANFCGGLRRLPFTMLSRLIEFQRPKATCQLPAMLATMTALKLLEDWVKRVMRSWFTHFQRVKRGPVLSFARASCENCLETNHVVQNQSLQSQVLNLIYSANYFAPYPAHPTGEKKHLRC